MKTTTRNWIATLAIACFVGSATSQALAVPISVGTSAPNTDVLISQTSTTGYVEQVRRTAASSTNWREVRQTFTAPGDVFLQKISVLIEQWDDVAADPENGNNANYPTANLPIFVDVFDTTGVSVSSGTSLLSGGETGTVPDFPRSVQRWLTFDITDVTLSAGEAYGFSIFFELPLASSKRLGDPGGTGGVYFANGTNPYAGGRAFRYQNGSESSITGSELTDMAFVLQGVAVPEPSCFFLVSCGLIGLAGYRSRFRASAR